MSTSVLRRCLSSKSISFQTHDLKNKNSSILYLFTTAGGKLADLSSNSKTCPFTTLSNDSHINFTMDEESCPQGVQGDVSSSQTTTLRTDCPMFKYWLANCKRYGLSQCKEKLQGIQSGHTTMSQVLTEQALLNELLQKYEVEHRNRASNIQGLQESTSAFPVLNSPCPQGVQGDDCVQFKLWLENCYRFGYQDCIDQYQNFKAGRKTIKQIFAEQEKEIKEVVMWFSQHKHVRLRRNYSTSTSSHNSTPVTSKPSTTSTPKDQPRETPDKLPEEEENVQLSQKDKLKRAVKEYGSTVIVFHVSISLMSLGFFYLLVSSGVDVVGLLRSAGIGESILQSKLATGTGTFVVSYAVHKVFAPVRIATTLTATPLIVRYLRKIGFLKVKGPPSIKP